MKRRTQYRHKPKGLSLKALFTVALFAFALGLTALAPAKPVDAAQSDQTPVMLARTASASNISHDVYNGPGSGGITLAEKVFVVSGNQVQRDLDGSAHTVRDFTNDALVPNNALTATSTIVDPPASTVVAATSTSPSCGTTTNCTTTNDAFNNIDPGSRAPTTSVRTIPGSPDGVINYANKTGGRCGSSIPISSMATCSLNAGNSSFIRPIDPLLQRVPENVLATDNGTVKDSERYLVKDRKSDGNFFWPTLNLRLHDDDYGTTIDRKTAPGSTADDVNTNAYYGPEAPTTPRPGTDNKASPPTGSTDAVTTTNPSTGAGLGGEPSFGLMFQLQAAGFVLLMTALIGGFGVYLSRRRLA